MRYGCCANPDRIGAVAVAGFDFCELPARALVPREDDLAALPTLNALSQSPIPLEAYNQLIPADLPITGPHADHHELREYLQRAFGRMAQMGGRVAVLGSGGARAIPEGWDRSKGLDQLAEALKIATHEASRAGITLAIEHLNSTECNVLNTVAECLDFIHERGIEGAHVLADLYHLEVEHEPSEIVYKAARLLAHVHVAGGERKSPARPGYDYPGFAKALRAIGYDARVSAECGWDDFEAEAPEALAVMRKMHAGESIPDRR